MVAIDTNILIYLFDSSEPTNREQAIRLIEKQADGHEPCVLPWQVVVEFVGTIRRFSKA
jgi:predicted nucleic acid-binding protein